MKTEVKYQYALDDSLKVIDIGSERIISGNNYLCLSCGKHLRPVLGEIRQKHFRHKVHIDCSSETYLHNLAKRMFFQTYSNCLENNQPYILEHQAPKRCTACKEHGPCQVGYESVQTDLTRYYKEISIEARDGEFIPDILLRNGSKPLYIEIAVTHFIEERKESSGTRIVEITINNETDIDLIKSCVISENDYRVSTSNFNPAPIVGNFADDCQKTINCFVLHLNGNSVIGPVNARKYRQLIDAGIYVEKISGNGPATYINKVVELYLKGMKIKNCWLCAFHCLHYQYVESFCKLLKITLNNTNRAVECKSFKLKKIIPECDLIKDATDRVMNSREEKPARKQPPRTQQNNQNQVITYTDVRIKTTAIDFFDKILNNKNTYIPSTNIHRPSIEVIFIGHFLECDKCGSTLVFVTSAVFEYLLGRSDSYPFMSWSGDFYAKSKLDKLFAATVEERPSTHKFGTLVRQNGNLFVQCTNCSNITAPENPTPVTLFRRTLSEEAYKLVYKN